MPANTEHYVGGTKHFECRVKGHPRPDIRWYKDGRDITDKPRFKFDFTHEGVISMVIDNITHDDEGHYRCRAENCEGIASTSAYLFVRSHKDHPEESETSIHAMDIEEAIVFDEKEKQKRKLSKSNVTEPHFETPIHDTDETFSRERRLSTEEKEIVQKTFESVIESSASVRKISSQAEETKTVKLSSAKAEEIESAKIKADLSEKKYHSSDDSSEDLDSVQLKTISERSETTSSIQEALRDFEHEQKSLLMKNTARILSTDVSDEELSKMTGDFDSETESVFSVKESVHSLKGQVEMVSSKKTTSKREVSSKDGTSVITSEVTKTESVGVHSAAKTLRKDLGEDGEDIESVTESEAGSSTGSVVGVEIEAKAAKDVEAKLQERPDKDVPHFTVKPKDIHISEFDDIKLSCEVAGNPRPTLSWFRNGKPLRSNRRTRLYESLGVYHLEIHESEAQDAGEYICTASSSKGETSASVRVTMDGVSTEMTSPFEETVQKEPVTKVTETQEVEEKKKEGKEIQSAPKLVDTMTDSTVKSGETLKLQIRVKGHPQPHESWSKDGKKLKSGDRIIISHEKEVCTLEILNLKASDSGYYHFSAHNDIGNTSTDVKVTVIGDSKDSKKTGQKSETKIVDVPEFTKAPEGLKIAEFDDIKLSCAVIGDPKPTITWEKNGKPLRSNRRTRLFESMGVNFLEIKDCDVQDIGEYTCIATNGKGSVRHSVLVTMEGVESNIIPDEDARPEEISSTHVDDKSLKEKTESIAESKEMLSEPEILELLNDLSLEEGKTLKLTTQIKGTPQPAVSWSKDGQTLGKDKRIKLTTEAGFCTLEIQNVKMSDSGTYRLKATNTCGDIFKDITVSISGDAELKAKSKTEKVADTPHFKETPRDVLLSMYEDIKLSCCVSGDPVPTITWEKDGKPLRSNRRTRLYESMGTNYLEIKDCDVQDVGEYTCIATSSKGSVRHSIHVTLEGVGVQTGTEPVGEPDAIARVSDSTADVVSEPSQASEENTRVDETVDKATDENFEKQKIEEEKPLKPQIVDQLNDLTLDAGKTLKLTTQITGVPQPPVSWAKDDRTLSQSERVKITTENGFCTLEIQNVGPSDSGSYRLTAISAVGEISEDMTVTITGDTASTKSADKKSKQTEVDAGAPQFTVTPQNVSLNMYEDIQLSCSVSGDPSPKITWEKDGQRLRSNRRTRIHESMGVHYLEIRDCDALDVGDYTCIATNSKGSVETVIQVKMAGTEEKEGMRPKSDGPYDDIDIQLKKASTGMDTQEAEKADPLASSDVEKLEAKEEVDKRSEASISKEKVQVDETVSNIKDETVEEMASQEVKMEKVTSVSMEPEQIATKEEQVPLELPEDIEGMEDISVVPGSSLKLNVELEGPPLLSVSWSKDGKLIAEGKRIQMTVEDGECILEIQDTNSSDAGTYTMTATTVLGEISTDMHVTVTSDVSSTNERTEDEEKLTSTVDVDTDVGAPKFTVAPKNISVAMYEDIKLSCSVTGDPPPKISWEKNGRRLRSNRRTRMHESMGVYFLSIKDFDALDVGEYVCIATNSKGSATATIQVRMAGTEEEEDTRNIDDGPYDDRDIKLKRTSTEKEIAEGDDKTDKIFVLEKEEVTVKKEMEKAQAAVTIQKQQVEESVLSMKEEAVEETVTKEKETVSETKVPVVEESAIKGKAEVTEEIVSEKDKGVESKPSFEKNQKGEEKEDEDEVTKKSVDVEETATSKSKSAPEIIKELEDVSVLPGSSLKLKVKLKGMPVPSVTWSKDGKTIKEGNRIKMRVEEGECTLEIQNTNASDAGTYKMTATSSMGEISTDTLVTVTSDVSVSNEETKDDKKLAATIDGDTDVETPRFSLTPENISVAMYEEIKLSCSVAGDPPPKITWEKDGQRLRSNRRTRMYESMGVHYLNIKDFDALDEGEYLCIATNSKGSAMAKVQVKMAGVGEEEETKYKDDGPYDDRDIKLKSASAEKDAVEEIGKAEQITTVVEEKAEIKKEDEKAEAAITQEKQQVRESNSNIEEETVTEGKQDKVETVSLTKEPVVEDMATSSEKIEDEKILTSVLDVNNDVDTPRFTVAPQHISVAMYEDIKLSCSVTGNPQPTIAWEKDGKRIRSNRRNRLYESMGVHYLEIRDSDDLDLGEYVCTASNDKGSVSTKITVTMKGPAVETTQSSQEKQDKEHVLKAQEKQEMVQGGNISDLLDENLDDKLEKTVEETEQTLKWVDHIESSKAETLLLEEGVKMEEVEEITSVEPHIAEKMEDVSVEFGTTLKLQTQISGYPQPTASWSKDGKELHEGERITIVTENDIYTLNIDEVGPSDSGTYRLTAHNTSGDIFSDVTVTVVGDVTASAEQSNAELSMTAQIDMPQFTMLPKDVTVPELEAIKLSCTVAGDPKPTVTWKKDGRQLRANRRLRLYESQGAHYLEIPDSNAMDVGEYVCSATNSHGTVTASVHVMIEGMESSISTTEEPEEVAAGAVVVTDREAVESSTDEQDFKTYMVTTKHSVVDADVTLAIGDLVEVLDSHQKSGYWLIRVKGDPEKVFFVPSSILKVAAEPDMDEVKKDEESDDGEMKNLATTFNERKAAPFDLNIKQASMKKKERKSVHTSKSNSFEFDMDTSEDEVRLRGIFPAYVAIADYIPEEKEIESVRLTEGQIVEVIDRERPDSWLVRTRPTKTSPSKQGWVPSAYLDEKATSSQIVRRSTKETFREDVLQVSNKQQEAGLKKRYVIKEMEETEREYIKDLTNLIAGYKAAIQEQTENYSEAIVSNAETILSNVHDIFNFHEGQFLAELGECVSNPSTVGSTFLKWQSKFENYIQYWADRDNASFLLEAEDMQEFFKVFSKKLTDSDETLLDFMKKPVERLKMYQLLLKDILKYSARAGENCADVEAAIAMLIAIEKAVGNGKLIPLLEGYERDITDLGNLIRHDDFCIWEGEVSNSKMKDRHVFLFNDKLILTKKRKPESSSDQPGFSYKSAIDLSKIRIKDKVPEDERRFELWLVEESAVEKITFQARSVYAQKAWTRDIKEALTRLGITEPDRMPEKTAETPEEEVAPSDPDTPTQTQPTVKDEFQGEEQEVTQKVSESELESESLTKTDLETTDAETSLYETAPEFEDGTSRPFFKRQPKTVVCSESGAARLECVVGGSPSPKVKWSKGEKRLISGFGGVDVSLEEGVSTVTFSNVSSNNAGVYTVTISNDHGSESTDVELVVLEEGESETTVTETESEIVTEEIESSDVKETLESTEEEIRDTQIEESIDEKDSKDKEKKTEKQEEEAKGAVEEATKEVAEKEIKEEALKEDTGKDIELAKKVDSDTLKKEESNTEVEDQQLAEDVVIVTEPIKEKETAISETVENTEKESIRGDSNEAVEVVESEEISKLEKPIQKEVTESVEKSPSLQEAAKTAAEPSVSESVSTPEINSEAPVDLVEPKKEETKPGIEPEPEISKTTEKEVEKTEIPSEPEISKSKDKEVETTEIPSEPEISKPKDKEVEKTEIPSEPEISKSKDKEVEKTEIPSEPEISKPKDKDVETTEIPSEPEISKPKDKEVEKTEIPSEPEISKPKDKEVEKTEIPSEPEISKPKDKEVEKSKTTSEPQISKSKDKEVEKTEIPSEPEISKPKDKEVEKTEIPRELETSKSKESEVEKPEAYEDPEKNKLVKKETEPETLPEPETIKPGKKEDKEIKPDIPKETEISKASVKEESKPELKVESETSADTSATEKSESKQEDSLSLATTEVTETQNVSQEISLASQSPKELKYSKQETSISATVKTDQETVDTQLSVTKTLVPELSEKQEKAVSKPTESEFVPVDKETSIKEEEKKERKPKDRTPRAPQVTESMDDCVIELGDLARFDCRVSAYPDPEITWFKDGHKVIPNDRYELLNFHDDIFSLLIKNVDRTDSGRYTCLAKNVHGEAKSEALLNVLAMKEKIPDAHVAPAFLTKFYDIEAVEGVPVEFVSVIDGQPDPTVTWLLNGKEVENSSELLIRRQDDNVMLAFRSVQMEHSGEVICKLKNDSGEAMCKARLCVKENVTKRGDCPLFLERPSDTEVNEGGEVTFECVISGVPDPEVTWLFNGRELHESRRRTIRRKAGQKYSLALREIIPENAGVYTCRAVNRAGDASCAVELSVKELPTEQILKGRTFDTNLDYDTSKYAFPPSFTRRIQDVKVLPGRMARFECMVIGVPEPEVEWQKDGFPLKWGPKYKVGREGHTAILVVESCDTIDEGTYTCTLFNEAGKASCSGRLRVQEERTRQSLPRFTSPGLGLDAFRQSPSFSPRKSVSRSMAPEDQIPSMPIDKPILLEVKGSAAKLSWMPAPTSILPDKAQKITYIIEARELPGKNWVRLDGNIDATTHYVHGLKPDKEYNFRVKAENRYGVSESTLPCSLLPREVPKERDFIPKESQVPSRPVLPRSRPYISDIGKETVRVGWKPAEIPYRRATSVPPVSYRVEAQKLPSEEWVPLASRIKKPSLYLSDLEPNRDYNIRVRAQTPYGISQPTEPLWIPRAKAFTGVPVSRPTIVEIDEDTARLAWNRVNIPAFDHTDEPLMYMIEMQEPPSYRWRELARRVPNNYYIVRDLEQGQDYRFRVRAESREGLLSEPSPATSIFRTLALTHAPVDRLEIEEYDPELESVRLQWRKVEVPPFSDTDSPLLYMIEYENPQVEGWRPLVSGVPTTRYRVPDISPSDDYRFRVRALTPYGASPPSHPIGLYRKISPMRPLAQDLRISEMEPEGVRLSWRSASVPPTRASEPLSYQIEAMEYPKREWRPLVSNVRDTNYRLSGLKPSSDYSFRVRPQTPSGLLEPTAPITLSSLPVRPTLQSSEVALSELGSDSVRLQWKPAELPYYSRRTTPISYTVEYQESPSVEWVAASRHIPDTSYTVSGLKGDRNYRFRVRPETEEGPGEYSFPVNTYRRPAPVLPHREPRLTNITPSSATLTWQPASLASGIPTRPIVYRIEAREPPRSQWYEVAGRVPSSSYDLQFLHPDQDYMFRVIADYDSVLSEPTIAVYLPRRAGPPKMPREAPYASNVQPDSLILSWRSVELPSRITDYSPVTYRVEVCEHPRMDWQPLARQINQTHFHVTKLRPDLDYSFRIRAENEFGISDPTDALLIRKRAVPPTITQHEPLISDVRSDSLRLTWQPAEVPLYLTDSVPVTYNILMQESGDTQWQPLARRVAGTSYYVTGLSPNKDYSFRVQATNDFGTSIPSLPAELRRQSQGPVYVPDIDDIEPSSFRLYWKQPSKAKKATYAIETLEPSTWKWRPLVSRLPQPSFRVTDVQPTRDYIFRVRTEIDSKISEPSLPISFSSRRGLPTLPVERPTLSELYDDSVRISWHPTLYHGATKRSAPQAYRLEVRELPDAYWRTLVPRTSDWSYEVTDLRPNQDYAFRVRTVTDSGMSEPSLPVFLYRQSVTPKVPLPSPEIADMGDDYINLRWKTVDVPAFEPDERPLSFMIEAQRVPEYEWRPVARGVTSPSHRVTGLEPGQDYRFRIRGETPIGITQPSAPIPVYRKPLRSGIPITNVTIDSDSNQPYSARLRWNPVYVRPYTATKDTSYIIEMQEPPRRDWYTLARDVPSTTYTVPDLSPRKDYLFRIRARSAGGDYSVPTPPVPYYRDPLSSWDSLPPADKQQLEYVTPINRPYIENLILKVPPRMSIEKPEMIVISPDIVKLSWKSARVPSATAHLSATKYRVEVRHEDSFEWVEKADGIIGLNTTVKGLNPHVDYAFRVRAVNDFGWSEASLPVFLHRPQDLKDEAAEMEFEEYEVSGSLLGDTSPPKMPIDTPKMTRLERGSLKLSWTPARIPAYARKTPIRYIVEKKETSDLDWIPTASAISETYYVIDGVHDNTDYLFRIRAENEYGKSEATLPAALTRSRGPSLMRSSASRERDSESVSSSRRSSFSYIDTLSEGVPPRVPHGRPIISDVTETSLTLSWPAARMPSYISKKIKIYYIVESREPPNHLWMKLNENVDGCEYKVTGLRPDQDYMFRVRAFNDSGMSEPTLPVTLTREHAPDVEPRTMRRRSSVERFSSVERRTSRERSMSMERSASIPRILSRENSKKDIDEDEIFSGKTPDTTPTAPEFVEAESPTLQYGIDARPVKITLQMRGLPLPNVDWYFNDKKIMYGDRHEGYITPTGLVVLEFTPMMWSDVGNYKCVAENELGEKSLTVKLEIADPPTFLEPMKDLLVETSTAGQFSCQVDGIPYPTVKFMKDWRPVTETSRLKVSQDGDKWTLDLDKSIAADAGCYICMAENVAGKVFCTARLTVDDEVPKTTIFYKTSNIEDDYYILEELGRGRHSIVRRVIEKSSGQEFAAKFTHVREETEKDFFRLELDALIKQNDTRIEKLHDAYETKHQLILVVEIIKGGTLLDRICQDDQWSEAKAAQIIKSLIEALDAVHKTNTVHLDVKPLNLRMKSKEYDSLALIDFGFARKLPLSSDLIFNYGTPEFCSPEAVNTEAVTPASDMWSVGLITHILLTGVSPFYAPTIPESLSRIQTCNWKLDENLFSSLSDSCKDFILKLLIIEPESRLTAKACLSHEWLKMADKSDSQKIDISPIKAFHDRQKEEQIKTSVKTIATPQSLRRMLEGVPAVQGLVAQKDPQTGEIILPDTEEYGMYLDDESWYEWQSRHQQGPDSELFPLKDAPYTARVRGYKRAAGSVDEPTGPPVDSDEELDPKDKERMRTMKERKSMAEIDQEEIPPSLQKELEWMEETKKRRKSRDPDEFSISSKRSSIVSISTEGVPGPVFKEKLHDMAFEVGDTVILRCVVAGPPTPTCVWYKNEELLSDGNRLKMNLEEDGEATLTIRNAKPYDAGVYKCVGRNKFGRISNRMRLMQGDVPGRPGRPVVGQISSTEAVVIWEAPRSDGNSGILFYKLDHKARGKTKWLTGAYISEEAAIVANLEPDTKYTFRVSATNRIGTGHYSWASTEVTTKTEGSLPIATDDFLDLQLLRNLQTENQPTLPTEYDDIIPEGEVSDKETEIKLHQAQPDSLYNIGNVLYKGKFHVDTALTLPSENDKNFLMKTILSSKEEGLQELNTVKELNHERLLKLFNAYDADDRIHLIFEHVESEHVARHLSHHRKYSENTVALIIRQILFGLEYLHRIGMVHLNLQPASILVSQRERCEIKLTDFSCARKIVSPDGERVPRVGYADFIAPEVIVQDLVGFPADIWAVGALTFLLLSGVSPFQGQDYESTLVNVTLSRYDAADLYENITQDALRFLYKVMKRLPINRLTLKECLDHKWLQLSDKYVKEREAAIFTSNTLATFVQEYDAIRQREDFQRDFQHLSLPIQMAKVLPYEERVQRREAERKKASTLKRVEFKGSSSLLKKADTITLEEKLQIKADKVAKETLTKQETEKVVKGDKSEAAVPSKQDDVASKMDEKELKNIGDETTGKSTIEEPKPEAPGGSERRDSETTVEKKTDEQAESKEMHLETETEDKEALPEAKETQEATVTDAVEKMAESVVQKAIKEALPTKDSESEEMTEKRTEPTS